MPRHAERLGFALLLACGAPSATGIWIAVAGDAALRVAWTAPGGVSSPLAEIRPPGGWIEPPPTCVRLAFTADDAVVWPRTLVPAAASRVRVHVERLRNVTLGSAAPLHDVVLLADRTECPAGPPERIDALQAWIDGETPRLRTSGDGTWSASVPATAWTVLAESTAGPAVAHVGPADATAVLRPIPVRRTSRRPTVGGRAAPDETLVAPGRLDLVAAATLQGLVETGRMTTVAALIVGTGPFALPACEDVTLRHPSFGVAYATTGADEAADATLEPGAVAFTATGSERFTAHISVWTAWDGSGAVFSRPPDRMLRLGGTARQAFVVRGLPPGTYRYDYSAAPGDAVPGPMLRRGSFRVTAASPRAVEQIELTRP